jgi:alkylation response protein AidB-like acyl-CoA dehydrogenase
MQFAFTAEQQLIRESARNFFDECATSERLRAAIESHAGYDTALWQRLAGELGWAGIAIPERYGGSGLGMVELAILQHEQGRHLVPSPFFSTVCLAAALIEQVGSESQQAEWLGRIASGNARVAVALTGAAGGVGVPGVTVELQHDGQGYRLVGESGFVIHGHACDALLVVALDPDSHGAEGISLVVVDPSRAGITIERLVMLDLTRPMARIRFDAVPVAAHEVLGEPRQAESGLERALDLARIALAAEAVGAAEAALEMTTRYAKDRVQFGRPIGSFQAVKHRLADTMVAVEAARSASWYAACVADELPQGLAEAASIAKASCCDAFFNCASNAIQLHGGIGFTWEHDAHLYFKRARACSTLLGSPAWHRERLARLMGLGAPAGVPAF